MPYLYIHYMLDNRMIEGWYSYKLVGGPYMEVLWTSSLVFSSEMVVYTF